MLPVACYLLPVACYLCHSGSGTRDIVPEKGVRHAAADRRSRSLEEFIFSLQDLEAIQIGPTSQGSIDEPSGWNLPVGRHILFSGCRDSELASEYSGDGQQRGVFSSFLLDTLQKTNGSLTYRELFKRASTLVRSRIKDQSPQLEATQEGDLELPFLGAEGAIAIASSSTSPDTATSSPSMWKKAPKAIWNVANGKEINADWVRGYLQNNPHVSDRHLCDGIGTQKR